ncbi:MAG: glycoside hydrolase family 3 C-terminal domain-containing protein [Bacteroidales bacterium]|nr:glycoside hydrolase family 3 C-terminal domain-containing protein [Bacteroidales bacterium]
MKPVFSILLLAISLNSNAQIYKDSTASVDDRVHDLLGRMTIEEKFWQLFMLAENWNLDKSRYTQGAFGFEGGAAAGEAGTAGQMIQSTASGSAASMAEMINKSQRFFIENTRLGIPILPFDEALHGLVHPGATAFPQSIALAATFDTALVHRVAAAIAIETKSRGIRQVLSPVINIAGDVRWGRVEETYGEDPFLTSEMAVAFISEFEKRNIIATPKHFVSNYGSGGRDSYPVHYNERYLRETELPPFEAAFKRAGARSVMTAYNSLDGSPCTASNWLLNTLLKKEWGFRGFVISDAGATGGANVLHFTADGYQQSTENAINNGLDVIFQTDYKHYPLFIEAFRSGKIPAPVIDSAVARVLKAKFQLGLFEHPWANPAEAARLNGAENHRAIALEAARESMVLLKNQGNILPFGPSVKSIAVVGPDAMEARLGGYSGPGNQKVSMLDGIRQLAADGTQIRYARGCEREVVQYNTVTAEYLSNIENDKTLPGLRGSYYSNVTFSGNPAFVRTDPQINFQWTLFSPDPEKLNYDFYSVQWEGKIRGPATRQLKIGIDGNDGYRLFIDNKLLIDNRIYRGRETKTADFDFVEGREYDLRIEYAEPTGNAWFRLVWDFGVPDNYEEQLNEAVELASASDAVVLVAGIEEGEFRDRALLSLPGNQEELITRLAATGKPVVVILTGGSAITMNNWLSKVQGVLYAWYPGEAGGTAVAEVLFGKTNPGGRLPITFPVHEGQLPLVYNHKPTGRGDDYLNLTGQPLFPFGFGLSYTAFEYSNLQITKGKEENSFTATFNLTNTGSRDGDEVVQLYIRDLLASVARPVTELKGFSRIALKAGETRKVTFSITPAMLQMLDINLKPVVEPGEFRIMIGASSKDIRLSGMVRVE